MPKIHDDKVTVVSPESVLAPYQHHGLRFEIRGEQAIADCPFCGKENKFSLNIPKTIWKCWACKVGSENGGGNLLTFFRTLHDFSSLTQGESGKRVTQLSKERGIDPATMHDWGLRIHPILDTWILPGYDARGKIAQIYTWLKDKPKEDGSVRYSFHATKGTAQQLHLPATFRSDVGTLWIAEGPWDGMKLWESLQLCKRTNEGDYEPTSNPDASLWSENEVCAVPGCGTFMERSFPLFEGKKLVFVFDNDHDRTMTRGEGVSYIANPGYDGMKRAVKLLSKHHCKVKETSYLSWGGEGKQFNPDLKDGHDVRDELNRASDRTTLATILGEMLSKVVPTPADWVYGASPTEKAHVGSAEMTPLPCSSWETLENAWRVALKWTDDMSITLSSILASVLSVSTVGSPVWLRVLGPPSTGKTTLLEAIAVAKDYVVCESHFTGFHSGWQGEDKSEDHSLMARIIGKTFVIKEADTLDTAPNSAALYAELRDLYDGKTSKFFKNGVKHNYENFTVGNIIGGVEGSTDKAEKGMRHLTCVISREISQDLEEAVTWKVANRAFRNMVIERNGDASSHRDEDIAIAMRLTGGFVEHLRRNAGDRLKKIAWVDSDIRLCQDCGTLSSFLRARPPKGKDDKLAVREMSARLVEQYSRLLMATAAVLGKSVIDDEVKRRLLKVVHDTSGGRTIDVVRLLHRRGQVGMEVHEVSAYIREMDLQNKGLLRFLKSIKAVETFLVKSNRENHKRTFWRLTSRLTKLCNAVFGPVDSNSLSPAKDKDHDD